MNEREAIEINHIDFAWSKIDNERRDYLLGVAMGYLECLEQARSLVEFVRETSKRECGLPECECLYLKDLAESALAKWEESQK